MLPEKHRLKTKSDFDRVYKNGRRFRTKEFIFIFAEEQKSNLPEIFKLPRFGFVVSKKVDKAAGRNRIKRLLREIVRLELPDLNTDFEAIFLCLPGAAEANFSQLNQSVQDVFLKCGLYNRNK